MSVNVPTNPKIKEKDVNAKLQLYGIYSGMLTAPRLRATTRLTTTCGTVRAPVILDGIVLTICV